MSSYLLLLGEETPEVDRLLREDDSAPHRRNGYQ